MPFVDSSGAPLVSIELGQVPVTAPTFQLRERIGYFDPAEGPGATVWADAHRPDPRPSDGNRTDLASVPTIFWSLIASYGRQTAPAVVHDSESWRIRSLPPMQALPQRERADRMFRLGLRELGVSPFRAWLMWTFVSFERYQKHAIPTFVGMLLLAALGVALVATGATLWLAAVIPWWQGALLAAAPLATAMLAGRQWRVLVWASYAGALLLPIAAFQIAAYLPYLVIENLVWFFVDWLPHRKGSPVVGPTDVRNLRRS